MLQDSFTQQVSCRTYVETPHRVNLLSNMEKHHFWWPKIGLKQIAGCYAYQPNMGEVRWGLWSQKQSCSFSACSVGSLEKTNMIWVFSTFQWQWGWRRIQIQSWNFFGSSLPQQSSTQSLHRNFPMDQLHVSSCVTAFHQGVWQHGPAELFSFQLVVGCTFQTSQCVQCSESMQIFPSKLVPSAKFKAWETMHGTAAANLNTECSGKTKTSIHFWRKDHFGVFVVGFVGKVCTMSFCVKVRFFVFTQQAHILDWGGVPGVR